MTGSHSWKFIDSLGREVSAESLAMSVERASRQITLKHLRPTAKSVITSGKCLVFSDRRKRLYSSVPFDVIVKPRDLDEKKGEASLNAHLDESPTIFILLMWYFDNPSLSPFFGFMK